MIQCVTSTSRLYSVNPKLRFVPCKYIWSIEHASSQLDWRDDITKGLCRVSGRELHAIHHSLTPVTNLGLVLLFNPVDDASDA